MPDLVKQHDVEDEGLLSCLSDEEREFTHRCLCAVAEGLVTPLDLHSMTGLMADELAEVIELWPDVNQHVTGDLAINNCLLAAWGYPLRAETWQRWFSEPRHEAKRVLEKWRAAHGTRSQLKAP
jgi:hypothetical protein